VVGPRGDAPALIRYVVRRLLLAVPTLLGILFCVFLLSRLAPGDPASALARGGGRRVSPEAARALRHAYGLDRPMAAQLAAWLEHAARLDFGLSYQDHRPVSTRIFEALPYTLELNALALLLTLAIGIPLGVAQARRAGSALDRTTSGFLFLLYSMPSFWVAMLLLTLFSVRLRWLPLFGVSSDLPVGGGGGTGLVDRILHLVLPVTCLTYVTLAYFTRMVRSSVREEMGRPYVVAAIARGASPGQAVWRHALRNAMLPLLTLVGLLLPGLLSGSVIIEQIFAWPGLGRLYFGAILARDYPVVLGLSFFTAVLTLAAILLTDLLYAAADPRVRYE
jgi:peptide/nickel transport system permease protein